MLSTSEITVRLTYEQMEDVLLMSRFYTTVWQHGGKIRILACGWNFNSYGVSGVDDEAKLAIKLIFG